MKTDEWNSNMIKINFILFYLMHIHLIQTSITYNLINKFQSIFWYNNFYISLKIENLKYEYINTLYIDVMK